jgi:hypothetical protein
MLISWFYYGLYYIIFRKPSPVVHHTRNDSYRGPEMFQCDFDNFDYYNDIHLDVWDSSVLSNHRESGDSEAMMYSYQNDEFFDAMMFPLNDENASSNHTSQRLPKSNSRHSPPNDFDVASVTLVNGSDDDAYHEDFWEDLSVVNIPNEVASPLAAQEGHQTPMKSRSFDFSKNSHTPRLVAACCSPDMLPVREEGNTNSTASAQMREISNAELEEIWTDFVDRNKHDERGGRNGEFDEGSASNCCDGGCCRERHPFFVFCHSDSTN